MVERYVILANSNDKTFDVPRQLVEINGERLIERTIRLLKENGVKDILITSYDKRFDNLGAKRYEPLKNDYDYLTGKGYWLNAFPIEIMDEPICFIWGDVYFSDDAIKTIVETDTKSTLFFCSHNNQDDKYIKRHDEPLAYKVVDTKLFIEHIDKVKKLYDEGKTNRHPIVWELYRSINELDVNEHIMTNNYVAINDISCDIDGKNDVKKLKMQLGEIKMKELSLIIPYYNTYELTEKLLDALIPQLTDEIEVILIDDGCNEKRLDKYAKDITIIHLKENVGGATASNIGIDQAKSKYIGFIDSDDMIALDYIKTLLDAIKTHNEDAIFFDWQDMGSGYIVHHPNNYAPWKAIYKLNIIPRFLDGRIYSYDVSFYEELNSKSYSKYYIDKVLYYYNSQREDNLTHKKEKERRKNMIKVEALKDFRLERFDELVDLERKNAMHNEKGKLYEGDTFYCTKEMADYLMGNNPINTIVVKLLEVAPELAVEEAKIEENASKEKLDAEMQKKPKKKKGKR